MSTATRTARLFFIGAMLVVVCALMFVMAAPQRTWSQSNSVLNGYVWSDTIGWISLDCTSGSPTGNNICATSNYSISVDASGFIDGYGWSDSIGWIKFGGLSDFPSGDGTTAQNAKITANQIAGWIRACAGTIGGDCSSMNSSTDGWDGWISLSGNPTYGASVAAGIFSGFGWGSDVVGWLDFDNVSTTYQACEATQGNFCDPSGVGGVSKNRDANCNVTVNSPNPCQWQCETVTGLCILPPTPTGSLSLRPSIVTPGTTTTVSWIVQDALTCTAEGENGDIIISSPQSSSPITESTRYVLTCNDTLGSSFVIGDAVVSIAPTWREK